MKKIIFSIFGLAALAACGRQENIAIVQQCGDYVVEMTFSESGDALHAVINGDELDLTNVVAASGAKYDGVLNDTQVTLWGKGEEWIMILDDDMVIQCSAK